MDLVKITNGINEAAKRTQELSEMQALPEEAKKALEKIKGVLNELSNESFKAQCDIEKAQGIYEFLMSETCLDSDSLDDKQLLRLQHSHKSNSLLAHVLGDYLYSAV